MRQFGRRSGALLLFATWGWAALAGPSEAQGPGQWGPAAIDTVLFIKEALAYVQRLTPPKLGPAQLIPGGHLQPVRHMVLLKATNTLRLTMDDNDGLGLGAVAVTLDVPCSVHYGVDLASLKEADFHWDEQRRLLRVKMPAVQVFAVEPKISQASHRAEHNWASAYVNYWSEGQLLTELKGLDFSREVRERHWEHGQAVRDATRASFQDLLRDQFRPLAPDIEVLVQ